MSAKTGLAPRRHTALAVAKNVKLGTITSSPGPTPSTISDNKSASLPEAHPTACRTPQYSAIADSKRTQAGPCTNAPDSQTSAMAASIRWRSLQFSRDTSSIGTLCGRDGDFNVVIGVILGVETSCGRQD